MAKIKKRNAKKAYFLIINLIIASFAFCYLIDAADCPGGVCGASQSSGEVATGASGAYSSPYYGSNPGALGGYTPFPYGGGAGGDSGIAATTGRQNGDVVGDWYNWGQSQGQGVNPSQGNQFPSTNPSGAANPSNPLSNTPVGSENLGGNALQQQQTTGGTNPNGAAAAAGGFFGNNLIGSISGALAMGGLGATVGKFAGGEDGEMWGMIAGFAGGMVYQIANSMPSMAGTAMPAILGIGTAVLIFLLTYK